MPGLETVEVAFQSIRSSPLRAALTMLGIVIGVAAVVTMVALGTGAQRSIQARIDALGTRLLTVYPGQSYRHGIASAERVSLTTEDARALSRDGRLFGAVVPEMRQPLQVKYESRNINVNVNGTTADFPAVQNYTLRHGRMFTRGENQSRRRYAVLGGGVPALLHTTAAEVIGQGLLIRSIPFEVIGVFDEKGSEGSWTNPDEQIVIPLRTARYRVFGTDRLRAITVQLLEGIPVERAMVDLERVLRREHKIRPGAENDFRIRNRQEILDTQQQASEVFTYLLGSIAGVSLLVGGIGIMNIMLVSVTERRREIGIRKAIGATRADILLQFLVEALVLCLVGGVVGILAGAAAALGLTRLADWNTFVSPGAMLIAFAFSAVVGVFFGLWPARQAASLDPIEALRHE